MLHFGIIIFHLPCVDGFPVRYDTELFKAEVGQVNNPDMIYDAAQFCKHFPAEHY